MTTPIRTQAVYEGGRLVLLARLEVDDATAAQIADIYSISIKVYNKADPANVVVSVAPVVADTIYDTLQTGNGWTIDSAANPDPISGLSGWNFKYVTPNTFYPQGNQEYVAEAEVVAQPGGSSAALDHQTWETPTINLNRR